MLQVQTVLQVHVFPTHEQVFPTQAQALPGTQLQVQIAPGGMGEPQGRVYVLEPCEYVMPVTVEGLETRSIRQTGICLPSGSDQSFRVWSIPPETRKRPSGLMATGPTPGGSWMDARISPVAGRNFSTSPDPGLEM